MVQNFFKIKKDTALWPNEFVENERSGSNRRCILGNTGDYNENAQQLTMFLNAQNYQIDHRKDDDIYWFVPTTTKNYFLNSVASTGNTNTILSSTVYNSDGLEVESINNNSPNVYYLYAGSKYFIRIYHSSLYQDDTPFDENGPSGQIPIKYNIIII